MKKKPFVTLEQVKEMVKKYPTPFHIYDEKGIRLSCRDHHAVDACRLRPYPPVERGRLPPTQDLRDLRSDGGLSLGPRLERGHLYQSKEVPPLF